DYRAALHGGVFLERGLDLGRVDVGAAAEDHVAHPVTQVEVAVGVDPAVVAERLPPAVALAGLGADVGVGRRVAAGAQPHLAVLADGHLVAVGITDHDFARHRTPDRTTVLEPFHAADDA